MLLGPAAGGSSSTWWKRSGSSGDIGIVAYLRNGKAAKSAADTSSPIRYSRPSSIASNLSRESAIRFDIAAMAAGSASPASSSSIAFGSHFQTSLNQSMKMSISARRAGSAGKSGGSG